MLLACETHGRLKVLVSFGMRPDNDHVRVCLCLPPLHGICGFRCLRLRFRLGFRLCLGSRPFLICLLLRLICGVLLLLCLIYGVLLLLCLICGVLLLLRLICGVLLLLRLICGVLLLLRLICGVLVLLRLICGVLLGLRLSCGLRLSSASASASASAGVDSLLHRITWAVCRWNLLGNRGCAQIPRRRHLSLHGCLRSRSRLLIGLTCVIAHIGV